MINFSPRGTRNLILALAGVLVVAIWIRVVLNTTTTFTYHAPREERLVKTTAYSEIDSCHFPGCPMASGKKAYVGAVACPRHWTLGTQVEIQGLIYVCEDRYNADLDERIDIFMGYGRLAHERAKEFGVKQLIVVVK